MDVAVIGCGYVGLVTAAGLADLGHSVIGIDKDPRKINKLKAGIIPIYEPGLAELVQRNLVTGRLTFTESIRPAVERSVVLFITVGTPSNYDGTADLTQVEAVAREIAAAMTSYKVIINKSTVPVGTARRVKELIKKHLPAPVAFDVVSNPEFLREGSAVHDFIYPDRIVIGAESVKAVALMKELYSGFLKKKVPFIVTNPETSELIKYAANAFLANKIAFINELANLCEAIGGDIETVALGMGLDHRIGPHFLKAGPGYGGSCFPKDTWALIQIGASYGSPLTITKAGVEANENHKRRMALKIKDALGSPAGKTVAVLGLAFKAQTDDLRESPAIPIIEELIASGVSVRGHDPAALTEAKKAFADTITYYEDIYEAARGADAIVIATEWEIYRQVDLPRLKSVMKDPVIIDLRNIYRPDELSTAGFRYTRIGQKDIR